MMNGDLGNKRQKDRRREEGRRRETASQREETKQCTTGLVLVQKRVSIDAERGRVSETESETKATYVRSRGQQKTRRLRISPPCDGRSFLGRAGEAEGAAGGGEEHQAASQTGMAEDFGKTWRVQDAEKCSKGVSGHGRACFSKDVEMLREEQNTLRGGFHWPGRAARSSARSSTNGPETHV
jgi:hypothetical protein